MSCTELCLRKRILEMPDASFPTPFSSSFCVVAIIDVSVVCVVEGGDDDDFSDTLSRVSNGVLFVLFIAVVVNSMQEVHESEEYSHEERAEILTEIQALRDEIAALRKERDG